MPPVIPLAATDVHRPWQQARHGRRAQALYPAIEPYASGFLEVAGGHTLYWETCGNPAGTPVLFLHGGPGGGCTASSRRWFDPQRYRIVLFDQRGCGRSRPLAGIAENTTEHLIEDIEVLRRHCGIERWLLFGGSWGATLALAYGQRHPARVRAMILRGVFAGTQPELDWLYREGASKLFPEAWEHFRQFIPAPLHDDLIAAYHARLNCGDAPEELRAARAWCAWEDALTTLLPQPGEHGDGELLALARIECHYFRQRSFLDEGQLLAQAHLLRGIPAVIVQGRYDLVTPPATAWQLARAWPQADLQIAPDAGHASSEPGNLRRLLLACDRYADGQ